MHGFAAKQGKTPGNSPASACNPEKPKLSLGRRDHPLEREADNVADTVLAGRRVSQASHSASSPTDAHHDALTHMESSSVHDVLRASSEPLDAATRRYFEPRFGRDFSNVRVHVGAKADASTAGMGASAYALGQTIVFGRHARAGLNVLTAHELAHVAQSMSGAEPGVIRRGPKDEPKGLDVKIVSELWDVDGRKVVVVESGGARTAFYQRSSSDDKGRAQGHRGPQKGDWAPFDGFSNDVRDKRSGELIDGYFEKNKYWPKALKDSKLYGYLTQENRDIGQWLKANIKDTDPAKAASWQNVQGELEKSGVKVLKPLKAPERPTPVERPARSQQRGSGAADTSRRGHIEQSNQSKIVKSGQTVSGEISSKTPPVPPKSGGDGGGKADGKPVKTAPEPPKISPSTSNPPTSGAKTNLQADLAKQIAGGQDALAKAQRFSQRLQGYMKVWGGLTDALSVLGAIESMSDMLAHGTSMPKEQKEANLVLQDSNDAITAVEAATEDISLFGWTVLIGEANLRSDEKALWALDEITTKMARSFETSGNALAELADGLATQADDVKAEMREQYKAIQRASTSGTADNAIAFAVYTSLEKIHGTILSASRNFRQSSETLISWATNLSGLSNLANSYAWDAAQKRAVLNLQLEQAKQFRSEMPVEETAEQRRLRLFLEGVRDPGSLNSSRR